MKKNDLIIIATGLLIALAVYGGVQLNNNRMDSNSKEVQVYIDGVLKDVFPLDADDIHRYETDYGYNIIEISDGSARIIEANCLTQSCVEDGAIESVNESVVCLPHHFHIQITGREEVEIDAISE